jgi:hypothetical protein
MTRLTKRNLMFAVPVMILLIVARLGMNSTDDSSATNQALHQGSQALAQLRASIWGASDVMAAIRRAQHNGTADEKWFAQEILRECFLFTTPQPGRLADVNNGRSKQAQRDAWAVLEKRCEGIKALSWDERRALVEELKLGAAKSAPMMHALMALTERRKLGDHRLNTTDLDMLTDAIHGDDPIERREAYGILFSSIDKDAPGGQARYEGLLFSLADDIRADPPSEFELLERCAIFPNCASDASTDTSLPDDSVTLTDPQYERLKALYAEAFAKRLSASAILAIR